MVTIAVGYLGFDEQIKQFVRTKMPWSEQDDMGIVIIPRLPEDKALPLSLPFAVSSTKHVVPDFNISCIFDEVKSTDHVNVSDTEAMTRQRFENLNPSRSLLYSCYLPLASTSTVQSAIVTVDIDFSVAAKPDRYFARRTFRLTNDRVGLPTLVFIRGETGPASKRPPR